MASKLYIRTDGGPDIGLGHINRCLAFADFLKTDFAITFLCKEIPSSSSEEIIKEGYKLILIKNEFDFISKLNSDITVLLDGYHFYSDLQKAIKYMGCPLVCIDDIQDRHYYADLVINHGPGINIKKYSAESYTKFLTGTDYIMLRKAFLRNNINNVEKNNDFLICVGGSDPNDYTYKICKTISESEKNYSITAIVGNSYNGKLNELNNSVKILKNISSNEVSKAMQKSRIGFFPASTIAFEAIAMRLPFIVFYYVDNQSFFYNYLVKNEIALPVDLNNTDALKIDNLFSTLENNGERFLSRSKKLIDFKSPERIKNALKKLRYEKRY